MMKLKNEAVRFVRYESTTGNIVLSELAGGTRRDVTVGRKQFVPPLADVRKLSLRVTTDDLLTSRDLAWSNLAVSKEWPLTSPQRSPLETVPARTGHSRAQSEFQIAAIQFEWAVLAAIRWPQIVRIACIYIQ
jgi:hypothetical protein